MFPSSIDASGSRSVASEVLQGGTKNCRRKFLSPDGTFMHYWTQTLSLPLFFEIDADSDGANVRVKRSKNEQNTTSIRQIVKIALRHATRIQKFPEETGYLSRESGAANLKTARKCVAESRHNFSWSSYNGRIRPII